MKNRPTRIAFYTLSLVSGCASSTPAPATPTFDVAIPTSAARPADSSSLEQRVRAELQYFVEAESSERAAIVILDPETGETMVAAGIGPDTDGEADRWIGAASTFKPFLVAAALAHGISVDQRFPGGPSITSSTGLEIRDQHPRESFNLEETLVYSSNVAAARVFDQLGAAAVQELVAPLGMRRLPERDSSEGAPLSSADWSGPEGPRLATGIGVSATPQLIARGYAAIANGGTLRSGDGTPPRQILSADVARGLQVMLEAATRDGPAHGAQVPGMRVAGKTGTGVTDDGYAALFAGFAPAHEPKIVVVIYAEVPAGNGGGVAAPSFSRIISWCVDHPADCGF